MPGHEGVGRQGKLRDGRPAIAVPRLGIKPRTHPIELPIDSFLHQRIVIEGRPVHEFNRQVIPACLRDTSLDVGKIHGGAIVQLSQTIESADAAFFFAMYSSSASSIAGSSGGSTYSASCFFQSALARFVMSLPPSASHCS
jgi:hypothetical protein